MGLLTICKTNMLNRDLVNYVYTIENDLEKQELTVFTDDPVSPMINMNYFYYKKGDIEVTLNKQSKSICILNNQNKMITIINDEIANVQDYYDNDVKLYNDRIRRELGEYIILTDDGKIKEIYQKGFFNNSHRSIFQYDNLGRMISHVTYKNDRKYGYTQLYQYDEKNRITRMIRKSSKTVISDVSNEYTDIPDTIVINEFTKFFNILGINRELFISELNNIDISIYNNIDIHDLVKGDVKK